MLDLENGGDAELFGSSTSPPELVLADGSTATPDQAALQLPVAFDTDEPLAPGQSRTGELRFELAGEQTMQVSEQESTLRLSTGDTTGPLSAAVPAAGS